MYINPFLAGVAATLLVEFGALIVAAVVRTRKRKQWEKRWQQLQQKTWREFCKENAKNREE